jgi:beta-glucosidase
MAAARVRGFQGDDFSRPDRVIACAKHWVAYGAAEGGRDYNTTDMSERTLREIYFPPFKAALDAGVGTFMSAFNDLNGIPTSGNPFTLTTVLRDEWRFEGFVVSDYRSVVEMIQHRTAADEAGAARQALAAGVDMEMVSQSYVTHGPRLVREESLAERVVDEAVRRVLRIKLRAGVFERPYADDGLEKIVILRPEHRRAAREMAAKSMVLLRNDRGVLPLSSSLGTLAVIGPLADDRPNMMGNWTGDGRAEDVVTVLQGIRAAAGGGTRVVHAKGAVIDVKTLAGSPAADDSAGSALIAEAVEAARSAEAVVLVLGETGEMSGEAASRTSLDLPGRQMELARRVLETGRPAAVVLMSGRPLTVGELDALAPVILEAWYPGTEAGHAVADVLFGKVNPGGKLPVTFPRTVGQVPIYYNHKSTGRPPAEADKYTSKYLDAPWTPLYPFGHGLSYTTFRLSDLRLSADTIPRDGALTVSVDVENAGDRDGDEVVQLYVTDVVRSVSPPVQELKGFERVSLRPGERRRVELVLGSEHLGFYDRRMQWVVEPGEFSVRVSNSSVGGLTGRFEVR